VRPACSVPELFVTRKGTAFTPDGLQTLMYRLKKASGLESLRWHLLRHTFANAFIANNGNLRVLQEILGHADVKTTASVYTTPELPLLERAHAVSSPLANGQYFDDEMSCFLVGTSHRGESGD
jgi:integrase/recombinase XerC